MIKPLVRKVVVGPIQTNCYVVECPETGAVLLIDPGDDSSMINEYLARLDLVIYTHGHFDHVGGASDLIKSYSPTSMIHSEDVEIMGSAESHAGEWGFSIKQPPAVDRILEDGDILKVGNLVFSILHTPGHSNGSICIKGHGLLFSGDTLFAGSIGRTDLPQSSPEKMKKTMKQVIAELDDSIVVLPGHGPSSTMKNEKRNNPFLRFR